MSQTDEFFQEHYVSVEQYVSGVRMTQFVEAMRSVREGYSDIEVAAGSALQLYMATHDDVNTAQRAEEAFRFVADALNLATGDRVSIERRA